MLVTLGGLFLVLTVIVAVSNQLDSDEALVAALWVGVPTVSGVLLARWGRRRRRARHTPKLDHAASE